MSFVCTAKLTVEVPD